ALCPGMRCQWGLGWMITPLPGPNGRSAGSLTWGGIFNSYYWIDPGKQVAGVVLTQFLPFADPRALALSGAFERGVYAALNAG
ncbi:MAG: serine hydrolase, partial [Stellaceae bacterium]